jgi:hypothetical protein
LEQPAKNALGVIIIGGVLSVLAAGLFALAVVGLMDGIDAALKPFTAFVFVVAALCYGPQRWVEIILRILTWL